MENFRDQRPPGDVPDAQVDKPADARTDTAADRADKLAIRFGDGTRVRRADLEINPDAKPPPGAEDKREAYLREYKKQLAPADTGEALLPDEHGGASAQVEQGPIADKVRAAVDKGRVAADRVLGGNAPDEAALHVDGRGRTIRTRKNGRRPTTSPTRSTTPKANARHCSTGSRSARTPHSV